MLCVLWGVNGFVIKHTIRRDELYLACQNIVCLSLDSRPITISELFVNTITL